MNNGVPSPDVKKDVPFPKSSFTHSAGIAQAYPLFDLKVPTNFGASSLTSSHPPSTHGESLNEALIEASVVQIFLPSIYQNTSVCNLIDFQLLISLKYLFPQFFSQNTGDTGKSMPSLSNNFTSNSSLPNQLGTPSSNVFAHRPTSCTTTVVSFSMNS